MFTVFSTSKDHGQGKGATCGCILVDFHRLLVINRSAKYKNKYVHRRDSVSLANLTLQELQAQVDLGLVVQPDSEDEEVMKRHHDLALFSVCYHVAKQRKFCSERSGPGAIGHDSLFWVLSASCQEHRHRI